MNRQLIELIPDYTSRRITIRISKQYPTFERSLTRYLQAMSTKVKLHPDNDPADTTETLLIVTVSSNKDFEQILGLYVKLVQQYASSTYEEINQIQKLIDSSEFMSVHKIDNPYQLRVMGSIPE